MGWLKPVKPKTEDDTPKYYDLWAQEKEVIRTSFLPKIRSQSYSFQHETKSELARLKMHIPAPKMTLPGHAESYNPPPEYLMTPEEVSVEFLLSKDNGISVIFSGSEVERTRIVRKKDRFRSQEIRKPSPCPSVSRVYQRSFRTLSGPLLGTKAAKNEGQSPLFFYRHFCSQNFVSFQLNVDPKDLLPKLPKPQDLQPFPTTLSLVSGFLLVRSPHQSVTVAFQIYRGHTSLVRTVTVEPAGQFLASGGDDRTIRIWEIGSGRCVKKFTVDETVHALAWCPNSKLTLIAAAV